MSQPAGYTPAHSFVSDSAIIPNFPGQALDVEFQGVKTTTDQIRSNLALIQRDDGALANAVVTYDSLSASVQSNGIAPASPWVTATAYGIGTAVTINSNLYRCIVAHTSGVFATDLAALKWTLVSTLPAGANGTNGSTILNGTGAPSAGLGNNGDFYQDTTATRLYGPKTAGAWGAGVSLIGPAGAMSGPGVSIDSEIAIFNGTSGNIVKRASVTGLLKATAGVLAAATANTDYLPVASPVMTGVPAAPTAAVDTNTTQLATTAMVLAQAASATPLIDGVAAVGSSTRFARGDHVHPTDTTRAALAGNQVLTGGFTVTSGNLGTVTSGTVTPSPLTNTNFQYLTANGAFTLAPPAAECSILLEVLNGASAGAITTSGFTKVDGTYATTNALKYIFSIVKTKTYSYLNITALQ